MIPQNKLTAKKVRALAHTVLSEHLSIEIKGYKCDTEMVYDVLLTAAVETTRIPVRRYPIPLEAKVLDAIALPC